MKRLGLGLAVIALCAVSGVQAKMPQSAVPVPGMDYVDAAAKKLFAWFPAPTLERFFNRKDLVPEDSPHARKNRVAYYGARNATIGFYALATYNAVRWFRGRNAAKKHHASQ